MQVATLAISSFGGTSTAGMRTGAYSFVASTTTTTIGTGEKSGWAVNSLAMLGTDDIVEPLLEVFATDASMEVRERAACSLADSGMLSFDQRKKSIPGFLRVLDDPTQNATVHSWVVHALEEISGEHFSANSPAWHTWLARQNF